MDKMDSMSAFTYINKLGGTTSPHLNHLAKQLWLWCMERNILLRAQHLPGVRNTIADESRVMKDRFNCKLCPVIFHKINQRLGPLEVDLFASRLTHQLPEYVSWRPYPMAMTTDAFTMDWAQIRGYAKTPWSLMGTVLAQTRKQQAEFVLVATVWKAVLSTTGHASGHTTIDPPEGGSGPTHTPREPPRGNLTTSHVDYLRQRYRLSSFRGS